MTQGEGKHVQSPELEKNLAPSKQRIPDVVSQEVMDMTQSWGASSARPWEAL